MNYIAKIEYTDILEKEFGKLKTKEVIITEERISHIKERHYEDYFLFETSKEEIVTNPDIIIKDLKNQNSVFLIKKLENTNINAVLKVITQNEVTTFKNSIITFYRIRDKNITKLIKKNKLLYRKD